MSPAAVVKVLGTTTEGDIADFADLYTATTPPTAAISAMRSRRGGSAPGFTLRGGTNEVLRGVIARGLGMR